MLISEEADHNPKQLVSNSSNFSDESNHNDSLVLQEIRATMAVRGQLGINFCPNVEVVLGKMIEIEAKEYSVLLEREVGG